MHMAYLHQAQLSLTLLAALCIGGCGDDSSNDTDSGTGADGTSTGGSCEPGEVEQMECGLCLADNCCTQVSACLEEENCACFYDCVLADGNFLTCSDTCGFEFSADPVTSVTLQCATDHCGPTCLMD